MAQQPTQQAQSMRMTQTMREAGSQAYNQGNRAVFWTNDFSDCNDWVVDNAYDNGLTQFAQGLDFECGVGLETTGFAPIAAINSTTADNGFMMVDSDLFGGEEGGTDIENNWFQTAAPINCTDHPFVSIKFENQYRMWDGGSSDGNEYCLVEVSRDGVTWPDLTTYEVSEGFVDFGDGDGEVQARWELWPDMATQDPVDNPTIKIFDITAAAGGQEEVWIRFRWKGTWGYAWMVDDVELFDTPDNDVSIENYVSTTDYAFTGMYEYGAWPVSQATEVTMAARVRNIGINEAENVTLGIEVNGADAGATATAINIPYATTDTVRATGYTIPAVEGTYDVTFTVDMDAEDENPADNVGSSSFMVTEYSYGRDDETFQGVFPADTYTDEFLAGIPYQFFGDATIYGIDVAIVAGEDDAPLIAHVLDFETFDILFSTDELELNPEFVNTNPTDGDVIWYSFRLEDPVTVTGGDGYFAAVESFGGSGVQFGRSRLVPDQTAFVYGDFGTDGFEWYFTSSVPMVRFNLDPSMESTPNNVVENEANSFRLFQNAPNPAMGTTRMRFELNNAANVTLEVFDLSGKQVLSEELGRRPAGEHQFDLNISDLAAGMYQYTLTVGAERATRKMIVK